eukprot:GHUV01052242.1.p1 GENE.GHUV01052242.1~~GHUV01052242.1.p1  ORF type:complete len:132 (+),score=19.16 GHUV01052242.1:95-490(+)
MWGGLCSNRLGWRHPRRTLLACDSCLKLHRLAWPHVLNNLRLAQQSTSVRPLLVVANRNTHCPLLAVFPLTRSAAAVVQPATRDTLSILPAALHHVAAVLASQLLIHPGNMVQTAAFATQLQLLNRTHNRT